VRLQELHWILSFCRMTYAGTEPEHIMILGDENLTMTNFYY